MLIGAFSLALGLTNDEALIFNVVIVGVFIGACTFAKEAEAPLARPYHPFHFTFL